MPDSGTPGYISIAADGTVVVPNNLTPEGVIEAGDLATHADVNDAVAAGVTEAENYTDASLTTNLDAILEPNAGDVVQLIARNAVTSGFEAKGPYAIAGEYAIDIDQATGAGATFFADFDFDVGGPPGVWPIWTIAGAPHWTAGRAVLVDYFLIGGGGNVVRFTFYSLLAGPGQITGTFYFHVIGTEP